jgi:CRISPR/Cas system CMR subunit Cmr4 (Cas7 group RAMP superfamily)
MIEKEIKEILQLSLEIKLSNDEILIEEMRLLVLDQINCSIISKTQEIRLILNKI